MLCMLIIISVFIHFVIMPIALYIGALYEPDISGHPDCDTLNDWLTYVLPVLQDAVYAIGIRICLRYP